MLFRVEWESIVVKADLNNSLSIVKSMVFVELNFFLSALIKLLLEVLLVGDHIDYALVDITAIA